MKKLNSLLKKIIIKIYAQLINLNLFFLHKIYKKIYYNHSIGFGDSLAYLICHYSQIKKDKKSVILNFGFLTNGPINFFFEKKSLKLFFYIFRFLPHYSIMSEVRNGKNFKPFFNHNHYTSWQFKNKDSIKNLLIAKINRSKILDKLKNDLKFNRKYVCISIKSYKNKDHFFNSGSRATYDLEIINKIIEYLINKGFDICILGLNSDYAVQQQKKKFVNNENVKFLIDYSKDYSFDLQLFAALNSKGYLGAAGGISNLYYWLHKKNIFINCHTGNDIMLNPREPEQDRKFNKYLFKKVKINNKYQDLSFELIKKVLNNNETSKFDIKENSFEEIRLLVDEYINKKFW